MLLQYLLHGRIHFSWRRDGRNETRGDARVAAVDQHLNALLISLFKETTQLQMTDQQSNNSTHLRDLKSSLASQDGAQTRLHCWRNAVLLEQVFHTRTESADIDVEQLKTREHSL